MMADIKKEDNDDEEEVGKGFNAQIDGIINSEQYQSYLNQPINSGNDSSNGDLGEITENLTQKFNESLSPGQKSLMI